MYALDGFAAKYTNSASDFGDYPQGIQLRKWWFVHLKPARFSAGLMFAGYYFGVILAFAIGAGIGGVFSMLYGIHVIWISCGLLLVSFLLMSLEKYR